MKMKYQVLGMTCGGCARALAGALAHAGIRVESADVSLSDGMVEIDADVNIETLRSAVEAAGFALGEKASMPNG